MNRERAKELLPVIQAFAEGKTVQIKYGDGWEDLGEPVFDFSGEYRIKPEPLECWVNVYPTAIDSFQSKKSAENNSGTRAIRIAVHMREVADD